MTLWLFGDSYAALYTENQNRHNQWMEQVAQQLNQQLMVFGQHGTDLSYTYDQFIQNRDNLQNNDIVIVCLTELDRKWFFEDRPEDSCQSINATASELSAIKSFRLYLDNEKVNYIHLLNFLYNLHYATEQYNLHTIIINNFNQTDDFINSVKHKFKQFYIANGILADISRLEMDKEFFHNWAENSLHEYRLNHLIRTNHNILTYKIVESIQKKTIPNLKDDFVTNVINYNTKNLQEWCCYEFFGNIWE